MPAPEAIRQLVERFDYNKKAYHSPHYNEAQLRQEFLNPFFKALGWDVYNEKDYALQYREVIHEDSIHIKGSPNAKAPDYAFRLGGVRKFFVEAKKPAEDIHNKRICLPAENLRLEQRYAPFDPDGFRRVRRL